MNKLIAKFLTAATTALAAFGAFACTDRVAGTAEEPNQFANGNMLGTEDEGSSSSNTPVDSVETTTSMTGSNSSAQTNPPSDSSQASSPAERISSSSAKAPTENPAASSSSEQIGGAGGFSGQEQTGFPNTEYTLDSYLQKYKVPGVTFDENVLAYNKTFEGCDATNQTCFESPNIAEFRSIGLHKAATQKELNELSFLFPNATKAMGGSLHEVDGCPLYVLNINETSPAVHILTKITKDTLTVATFYDNCDYERLPFDMYVGFLFSYCGELSEKPEIVMTSELNEAMTSCGSVDYKEYINKKLLSEPTNLSTKRD